MKEADSSNKLSASLAPQKEFESPTFRLGVAQNRKRGVIPSTKKCLEILAFSAFRIPSCVAVC